MFLISTRTEEQIDSGMKWGQYGWIVFRPAAGRRRLPRTRRGDECRVGTSLAAYVAAGLGYLLAASLVWIWMVFNSLVDLRQRMRQAWSLVDVQLQRRHDLIPNLVNVVAGYRDYEKQLQPELAALRGELLATPPGASGPDFNAVGKTAVAIAERYPDLKANTTFAALQKKLIDTEQRIALARGYFNDIATQYNTRLEVVPERYVAGLAAMQPQTLMAANDFERAPVKVEMASAKRVAAASHITAVFRTLALQCVFASTLRVRPADSAERRPAKSPSTLMSSSSYGQWIPSPSPINCSCRARLGSVEQPRIPSQGDGQGA